ncbi:MAG: DNA repair protein RecN [Clostridia bacterium]|nr:DNA repair protein RecN [Clostridia bacterium]
MITSLKLKNVALIESAEINFINGFNVLSGETGAGKSVIINGINFALGSKADKNMIRFGENFCQAEIIFDNVNSSEVNAVLDSLGIDIDDQIIIKRRFFSDGRGDIKINGNTVTLSMLKSLTSVLCDVYGQSEHYSLLNKNNQLKVLDNFCVNDVEPIKLQIKPIIANIKEYKKQLELGGGDERQRAYKLDLLKFQINEIESANIIDGEEEDLISKRKVLLNIEKIGNALQAVKYRFGEDNGVLDHINASIRETSSITSFSDTYSSIYDRLYSIKAESDDILCEVENLIDGLDFDGAESARIEERLDLIKQLKRKYGSSIEEINEYLTKIKEECKYLEEFEENSKIISQKLEKSTVELQNLYKKLTKAREVNANKFAILLQNELTTLGMRSAKFEILVSETNLETLSTNGVNEVEFLFSANAGEPLKTMSKVISGGEMSRFMLALKLVENTNDFTYIFDEIDAGISGDVAKIISQKFAILSKKIQIITISHLPQIVAYSDALYKIEKFDNGTNTITNVTSQDHNGKVNEIIRLTGGNLGDSSITHANQLIETANNYKLNIK